MIIILGTAHGENVSGKRSPDGMFREYKFSREVVQLVKSKLERMKYQVFVDIEDDIVPNKQSDELVKRVKNVNKICTKYGAKNCIYVSIHVNAAGNGTRWMKARGWSVYTSTGTTNSDYIATSIWNAANMILPHDNPTAMRADRSDGDVDYESNFYVLAKTKCPAVLTENLFMDNKEDVKYLMSEEGKNAIVDVHVKGICDYINFMK